MQISAEMGRLEIEQTAPKSERDNLSSSFNQAAIALLLCRWHVTELESGKLLT
jgi:hypothetical protein